MAVNCLCKIHISAKAIIESQKDTVIFEIFSFLYVDAIHDFYTKGSILWKSLEFHMSNNSSSLFDQPHSRFSHCTEPGEVIIGCGSGKENRVGAVTLIHQ